METKAVVVCIIVGLLGLLSTVLGFVAEAKRIKLSEVINSSLNECAYPSSPAFDLGVTAALILLVAQITINVTSGCFCCSRRYSSGSNSRWTLALVCFIFSWITFVFAFLLLLGGAALNNEQIVENMYSNNYCYAIKPGVLAGAATLSFVCIALGIISYLSFNSGKTGIAGPTAQGNGIAMGYPQVRQESAFVHEDAYAHDRERQ